MKVYIGPYPGRRSKKDRRVSVRIDYHDIWNLDHTLAHIIHPALILLKEKKHGAPNVDDEDVPEDLRSTSPKLGPKKNEWDTDGNHFLRWDWVIDEMIWAFGEEIKDNWEDQFYSGTPDIRFEPMVDSDLHQMVTGPNDTFKVDLAGVAAHRKRMSNGMRLFGKYYGSLWD